MKPLPTTIGANVYDIDAIAQFEGMDGDVYDLVLDDENVSDELVSIREQIPRSDNPIEDLENVNETVRDNFSHVWSIAKERNESIESVEKQRREAQGGRKIPFSNVLGGKFEGLIAGGCLERAVEANYLMTDFGYEPTLRMGTVAYGDPENPEYLGHAWNEVPVNYSRYLVDSAVNTFVDVEEVSEIPENYYKNGEFWIPKQTYTS